jgi:hypothetical protein
MLSKNTQKPKNQTPAKQAKNLNTIRAPTAVLSKAPVIT